LVALRNNLKRSNRPEQPVPSGNSCAGAPQDGTRMEDSDHPLDQCDRVLFSPGFVTPAVKTDSLDDVRLSTEPVLTVVCDSNSPSSGHEISEGGVFRKTGGNRHFRYHPYSPVQPSYSADEQVEKTSDFSDEEFTRNCIAALANLISRRVARAMIELVGIEPNPGPSTALVTVGRRSAAEIRSLSLRSSQAQSQMKKKKKKVRGQKQQQSMQSSVKYRSGGAMMSEKIDSAAYRRVLDNPFDALPVRLGGETMQPSGIATLTYRAQVATNSSGNLSVVYYPWANESILVSTTQTSNYSYTDLPGFPGGASLAGIASGGRIVAAGVRVFSVQSATNDQGVITIGCLPRDTVGSVGGIFSSGNTTGGFPYNVTSSATQGYGEFLQYLQCESYPVRCGASSVWRPEDPIDFTFRSVIIDDKASSVSAIGVPLTPFFVVGINGAAPSANLFFEFITHIEYTVNEGTTGVVNTGMGQMTSTESFRVAKQLFGTVVDTTMAGVTGGFSSAAKTAGKAAYRAAGAYFESAVSG